MNTNLLNINNIYHYTSFSALKSILENKTLWLNNTFCCNDSEEIRYYLRQAINLIKQRFAEAKGSLNSATIDEIYNNYVKDLEEKPAYVSCFSIDEDSAAQWDRYSNHGTGVCLKFSLKNLSKILPMGYKLDYIKYGLEDEGIRISEFIAKNVLDNNNQAEAILNLDSSLRLLRYTACSIKHQSFASEKEIRLFVGQDIFINANAKSKICYNIKNDTLSEYCELDLNQICKDNSIDFEDIITGITVGPNAKTTRELLMRYLNSIGLYKLANSIKYSNCPLR